MKITIRKMQDKKHEYFAYLMGMSGRATYLLYFKDDIYGAISLNHFVQMLKNHFKEERMEVALNKESEIKITNAALKEIFKRNGEQL